MKRLLLPICIVSLLTSVMVFCKQDRRVEYNEFKDKINEKLEILSKYDSKEYEVQGINPDSLTNIVANELVNLYRSESGQHFRPNDFPLLDPLMTKDSTFLVLEY